MGLVDHCVPDEELGSTVAGLAARIVANSPGTNRIVKALVADRATSEDTGYFVGGCVWAERIISRRGKRFIDAG